MAATWFTGRIGKSTSRQVGGRSGSEKSTVSTATGLPAPTAFFTPSARRSALVFFLAINQNSDRETSRKGTRTSSTVRPPWESVGWPPETFHLRRPTTYRCRPFGPSRTRSIGGTHGLGEIGRASCRERQRSAGRAV